MDDNPNFFSRLVFAECVPFGQSANMECRHDTVHSDANGLGSPFFRAHFFAECFFVSLSTSGYVPSASVGDTRQGCYLPSVIWFAERFYHNTRYSGSLSSIPWFDIRQYAGMSTTTRFPVVFDGKVDQFFFFVSGRLIWLPSFPSTPGNGLLSKKIQYFWI